MIISFVGCSASGKTTTAARVFSNLKEAGFITEFVPEQARMYIAEKRVNDRLQPTDKLLLSDEDQINIMKQQLKYQLVMSKACGDDAIIVTDSSPLNALLYMSESTRELQVTKQMVDLTLKEKTITFYCSPVEWLGGLDPNRVHSKEESVVINSLVLSTVIPLLKQEPIILIGNAETRHRNATSEVLRVIMGL